MRNKNNCLTQFFLSRILTTFQKQMGKSKKLKGKTSASKIANKRINKLAKQGKLRKETNKRKRREKLALKASNESTEDKSVKRQRELEEELPLQEDDISFYSTPGQSLGFASAIRDRLVLTGYIGTSL